MGKTEETDLGKEEKYQRRKNQKWNFLEEDRDRVRVCGKESTTWQKQNG